MHCLRHPKNNALSIEIRIIRIKLYHYYAVIDGLLAIDEL